LEIIDPVDDEIKNKNLRKFLKFLNFVFVFVKILTKKKK